MFSAGMLHRKPVGPSLLCAPNCGRQGGHGESSQGAGAWLCVTLGHVLSWDTSGSVRIPTHLPQIPAPGKKSSRCTERNPFTFIGDTKEAGGRHISISTPGNWPIPTRRAIRNIIVQRWGTAWTRAQSHSPSPSGLSSRAASTSWKWKLAIMSRTASISLFKPWLRFRPPAPPSSILSPCGNETRLSRAVLGPEAQRSPPSLPRTLPGKGSSSTQTRLTSKARPQGEVKAPR